MSIRCQTWVYEHSEATGNDRLVLLAIADEADDDGRNAFPGIDRIGHKARVPKRTTMRCLERLEASGDLVVNRPEQRGRGHHNTYVVVMGKGDNLAPIPDAEERRAKARKGAQPYLIGSLPIDPLTPTETDTTPRIDFFEHFWKAYPRKTAKGAARKAWPAALKAAGGDGDAIVQGANRYRHDPNREDAYTVHPDRWLREERWSDAPLPPRKQNGPQPHRPPVIDTDRSSPDRTYEASEL